MNQILSHRMAPVTVVLGFLLLALIISSWATCVWFLLGVLVCAVPGWFACRLLYGDEFARQLESLGHTLILGLLVTTSLSVIIAATGLGLNVPVMLVSAATGALLLFLVGRWASFPLRASHNDDPTATRLAITIGLIFVLVVVALPFLNVSREVGESYGYAPYFNRDFLRNIAFGAALSKGAIPPINPYFAGETLHYYWFQMVFPALVYRLSGLSIPLEDVFLLSTLLVDVCFVFVFVHLLQRFVRRVPALIIVLSLAFFAESYQAPFKAVLTLQPTHWALEGTWLGAISLPPVGYFFQHLLYLPHHLVALVALLIALSLIFEQPSRGRVKRVLAAATILVLSGGFSFFITAFGFLWLGTLLIWEGLVSIVGLTIDKETKDHRLSLKATVLSGLSVGGAGVVAYALINHLGMLLGGGNAWYIHVDRFLLVAPLHFLVMLGPMFPLGVAGFVVYNRREHSRSFGLSWLLLSAFFLIMFVLPRNLPTWEVSQKLGVVLRIPLLILSGILIDYLLDRGLQTHKFIWIVFLLFCASAIPNLLAYEYVHLDIGDSDLVTYVSLAEKDAAGWVREHTPLEAVVQAWPGGQTSIRPYYRLGEDAYSLIAVFGERQTAFGDPQFARYYLPRSRYPEVDARAIEISQIYENPAGFDIASVLDRYQIGYVYWGLSERECCWENLGWYETSPLFEKVYDRDGVSIFQVREID